MFQTRLVLTWGVFLTGLALGGATTLRPRQFLPGIVVMWMLLFVFAYGARSRGRRPLVLGGASWRAATAVPRGGIALALAAAFCVFFPAYIQFYTGQPVRSSLEALLTGQSNYMRYQAHFLAADVARFRLAKLPFVLGAGLLRFLLIVSVFRVVAYRRRMNVAEALGAVVMLSVTILVGLARGTAVEAFEMVLLLVVAWLLRESRFSGREWLSPRAVGFVLLAGAALAFWFGRNLDMRGELVCASDELCLDEQSIIAMWSPALARLTFQLAAYFSFGLFFLSTALSQVGASTLGGAMAMLLPGGLVALKNIGTYRELLCGVSIDCNVMWVPDIMVLIAWGGILGTVLIIFLLGRVSTFAHDQARRGSITAACLLYFVVLYMVSLFVGSLLSASSADVIACCGACLCCAVPALNRIGGAYFRSGRETGFSHATDVSVVA